MGEVAADEKLRNDANKLFLSMPARRAAVGQFNWQSRQMQMDWTWNAISSTDQSTTFPDH